MLTSISGKLVLAPYKIMGQREKLFVAENKSLVLHVWQYGRKIIVLRSFRSQPVLDDSSGKSGAKFYQSYDKLFIIKTLTSEEVERMHSFLKHYHPV